MNYIARNDLIGSTYLGSLPLLQELDRADVEIRDFGLMHLVVARTDVAARWLSHHTPVCAQPFADGIAVQPGDLDELVDSLWRAGFLVEGAPSGPAPLS